MDIFFLFDTKESNRNGIYLYLILDKKSCVNRYNKLKELKGGKYMSNYISTGPGNSMLTMGTLAAGYYGKVNGIITGTALYTATGTTGVGSQIETATVVGAITGNGNATVIVTAAGMTGSPITLNVAVTTADTTPVVIATKIIAALNTNANITAWFNVRVVTNSTGDIVLTTKTYTGSNDATMNISIANGTCTGITNAPTSVNTTFGDITWLKFASNNKTLFVADRNIKTYISWDQIQTAGCVKGKVITINGINYLCRLIQGCNINPAPNASGSSPYTGGTDGTKIPGINNEWDNLIIPYTPLEADSYWTSVYSWTQEAHSTGLASRVMRGSDTVSGFISGTSSYVNISRGWRPVLEVL